MPLLKGAASTRGGCPAGPQAASKCILVYRTIFRQGACGDHDRWTQVFGARRVEPRAGGHRIRLVMLNMHIATWLPSLVGPSTNKRFVATHDQRTKMRCDPSAEFVCSKHSLAGGGGAGRALNARANLNCIAHFATRRMSYCRP